MLSGNVKHLLNSRSKKVSKPSPSIQFSHKLFLHKINLQLFSSFCMFIYFDLTMMVLHPSLYLTRVSRSNCSSIRAFPLNIIKSGFKEVMFALKYSTWMVEYITNQGQTYWSPKRVLCTVFRFEGERHLRTIHFLDFECNKPMNNLPQD